MSVTIHLPYHLPAAGPAYDAYWRFAAERQEVYFRRLEGHPPPWTVDPVVRDHRFTNAYRAADRVSQYLIREVLYSRARNAEDTVFRVLLFKVFNRVETWEHLVKSVGDVTWSRLEENEYALALETMARRSAVYSAAYMMPPPPGTERAAKCVRHLSMVTRAMRGGLHDRVVAASSLEGVYQELRGVPGLGGFLAYQFAVDVNYSEHVDHDESSFVVPGPGAIDGIRKCFPGVARGDESRLILRVTELQKEEFSRRDIAFRDLWGRRLQAIDCQNLFCEISKWTRVAMPELRGANGRMKIKQRFAPAGSLRAHKVSPIARFPDPGRDPAAARPRRGARPGSPGNGGDGHLHGHEEG